VTSPGRFYDALYAKTVKRWPHENVVGFIERNREALRGRPVLDNGCGAGRHSIYMAQRGIRALGIDVPRVAIQHARVWAEREAPSACFLVADSAALPLSDASMAGLISWEAMYYGDDKHVRRCVREALRVLQPGAPFLLLLKSKQDFRFERFERVSANTCASEQGLMMSCFDRDELAELLRPGAVEVAIETLAHSLHDGRDMVWNFSITGHKERGS